MESQNLRSPRITHISWGRMEIEGLGIGKDFKLFVEHEDRAATIQLGAVGCVLALADIYERIEFASAES